jgi:hypothetical protein
VEHRVEFDFAIHFSDGGGLLGEGFRLDIERDDVNDAGSPTRSSMTSVCSWWSP